MIRAACGDAGDKLAAGSCDAVFDQLELFARVPAERIVFASDVPYGRPVGALYTALRIAAYAGLGENETRALVGGTMLDVLEGRPLAEPRTPRVPEIRPTSGRLARINAYVLMSFAAAVGAGPPPDFARSLPFIAVARAACRDPDPGPAGPALERIDKLLATAELLLAAGGTQLRDAAGLVMAAGLIAATEPFVRNELSSPDPRGGVAAIPLQSESPVASEQLGHPVLAIPPNRTFFSLPGISRPSSVGWAQPASSVASACGPLLVVASPRRS